MNRAGSLLFLRKRITSSNSGYNGNMGGTGGITQSGTSGSLTYSTIAGRDNLPLNYVSFYDSLRFSNWLQNGQPTGAQGNATTEDGAYTITSAGIANNSITRNAGASIFLTSENEWYKAAYHKNDGDTGKEDKARKAKEAKE